MEQRNPPRKPDLPPAGAGRRTGRYRHYKGNEYRVLGFARHSETLEELVIYQQLYGNGAVWARPLAMFFEEVEVEGRFLPRFAYLGESPESDEMIKELTESDEI